MQKCLPYHHAPLDCDHLHAMATLPFVAADEAVASAAEPQLRSIRLEKHQHQLARNSLLAELRRATNFWFRAKSTDGQQLLTQSCTRILRHGMVSEWERDGEWGTLIPTLINKKYSRRLSHQLLAILCLGYCEEVMKSDEIVQHNYDKMSLELMSDGNQSTLEVTRITEVFWINKKNNVL